MTSNHDPSTCEKCLGKIPIEPIIKKPDTPIIRRYRYVKTNAPVNMNPFAIIYNALMNDQ